MTRQERKDVAVLGLNFLLGTGMTQTQIAGWLGKSVGIVSQWANGTHVPKEPNIQAIIGLCRPRVRELCEFIESYFSTAHIGVERVYQMVMLYNITPELVSLVGSLARIHRGNAKEIQDSYVAIVRQVIDRGSSNEL